MGSEGRGLRQRSERTLARAPALQAPLDAGQHGGLLLMDEEVPAVEQLQFEVGAGFLAPGQQLFLAVLVGAAAEHLDGAGQRRAALMAVAAAEQEVSAQDR